MAFLVTAGFLVSLGAAAVMLYVVASAPRAAVRRLQRRAPEDVAQAVPVVPGDDQVSRMVSQGLQPFARLATPTRDEELVALRGTLVQAGLRAPWALQFFLAAKVLLGLTLVAVVLWVNAARVEPLRMLPGWVLGAAAVGFFAPNLWLRNRVRDRQLALDRGLPDALDLMVTCVEAGLGLDAALRRVADEISIAQPVLGEELTLTFLEVKAGVRRVEAFRRLASRTGVPDLKTLAATLNQTDLFGTSVATALRIQSEGMRVRRMQRAEEKAAMLSVKMAMPLVTCFLPALLTVVGGPAMVNILEKFVRRGP
jgi:tight adherence protein C